MAKIEEWPSFELIPFRSRERVGLLQERIEDVTREEDAARISQFKDSDQSSAAEFRFGSPDSAYSAIGPILSFTSINDELFSAKHTVYTFTDPSTHRIDAKTTSTSVVGGRLTFESKIIGVVVAIKTTTITIPIFGGRTFGAKASNTSTPFLEGSPFVARNTTSNFVFGGSSTRNSNAYSDLFGVKTTTISTPIFCNIPFFDDSAKANSTSIFGGRKLDSNTKGGLFGEKITKSAGVVEQKPTGTMFAKYSPVVGIRPFVSGRAKIRKNLKLLLNSSKMDHKMDTTKMNTDHVKYNCITFKHQYKDKSLDELRLEDYMACNKKPTFGVQQPLDLFTRASGSEEDSFTKNIVRNTSLRTDVFGKQNLGKNIFGEPIPGPIVFGEKDLNTGVFKIPDQNTDVVGKTKVSNEPANRILRTELSGKYKLSSGLSGNKNLSTDLSVKTKVSTDVPANRILRTKLSGKTTGTWWYTASSKSSSDFQRGGKISTDAFGKTMNFHPFTVGIAEMQQKGSLFESEKSSLKIDCNLQNKDLEQEPSTEMINVDSSKWKFERLKSEPGSAPASSTFASLTSGLGSTPTYWPFESQTSEFGLAPASCPFASQTSKPGSASASLPNASQKSESDSAAANLAIATQTSESDSAAASSANASQTPKSDSAAANLAIATQTSEADSASASSPNASQTPKSDSAAANSAIATQTSESDSASASSPNASQTPKSDSAAASSAIATQPSESDAAAVSSPYTTLTPKFVSAVANWPIASQTSEFDSAAASSLLASLTKSDTAANNMPISSQTSEIGSVAASTEFDSSGTTTSEPKPMETETIASIAAAVRVAKAAVTSRAKATLTFEDECGYTLPGRRKRTRSGGAPKERVSEEPIESLITELIEQVLS